MRVDTYIPYSARIGLRDAGEWHFQQNYRGSIINVLIPAGSCSPEAALARATWAIHDKMEEMDSR